MNIQEEVRKANARLKAAKMGVALQLRGDRISLIATLLPKTDSIKTKDHQQRIPLGIYANHQGPKQAEAEAKMVALNWLRRPLNGLITWILLAVLLLQRRAENELNNLKIISLLPAFTRMTLKQPTSCGDGSTMLA
ncbi:hypothetical protein [Leptolyngbya sp. FACHB-671]|uniref:hypothetical protein n=1 Tax=Leptolyngbya sp. FACHB-671 TaxID=2692812 RepID=UPI00168512BB|nr:hypothetical protein [Leptolyngbya sp. FACHB-671]